MRRRPRSPGFPVALAALLGLALAGECAASQAWPWAPDHLRLQFAGDQGVLSVGTGYGFLEGRVEAQLAYGFAPAPVAGRSIHTFGQKTTLAPSRLEVPGGYLLFPLLIGYSANLVPGENYDLILPDRFRGYYWPSALHFWFFTGTRLRKDLPGPGFLSGMAAVLEIGASDPHWRAFFKNEYVGLEDILSLALAMQAYF